MTFEEFEKEANDYSVNQGTDILAYFGGINRGDDDKIIDLCRQRNLRKNVLLFLMTRGGDPNAAYRFSKCLQKAYKTINNNDLSTKTSGVKEGSFIVFIDGLCKSAGTLICLGADEIIMSGNGELGPIDIQLRKKDEIGESESGLTPLQSLKFLELQSAMLFKNHFKSLRFSEDLSFSTKMAADIAKEITMGLMSPIYAQIDPIRLAEVDRSMRIAKEYGDRLVNDNIVEGGLERLLGQYPSHGFVIDRTETAKIFKKVIRPSKELRKMANFLRNINYTYIDQESDNFLAFISSEKDMAKSATIDDNNK